MSQCVCDSSFHVWMSVWMNVRAYERRGDEARQAKDNILIFFAFEWSVSGNDNVSTDDDRIFDDDGNVFDAEWYVCHMRTRSESEV